MCKCTFETFEAFREASRMFLFHKKNCARRRYHFVIKNFSKCACFVVGILYSKSMKLMTQEIRKQLPDLYSQDGKGLNQVAVVKFFSPVGSWTWYATEFDGTDTFFGLVDGFEKELGYFSLSELESVTLQFGLKIERDTGFRPTPLKDLM